MRLLAAIALGAGLGLAACKALIAVTKGACHGNGYQEHLLINGGITMAYFPVKVQIGNRI